MRILNSLRAASLIALLALTGCQVWQPGGSPVAGKENAFTITPPAGWMYATSLGRDLLASKDGPVLQSLVVEHRDLSKPADDKSPLRTIAPTLAPFEAAEAVADELRANHELLEFQLKENTPATLGGKSGFKLVFSYRTKDGLQLTEARYGAIVGKNLWLVRFCAPSRHYFDRDLATFETAVKTLQFGKA